MSSIVVSGDTSGAVTLAAPAVAGTVTVTLPATSGTMALQGGAGVGKVLQVVSVADSTQRSTTSGSFVASGMLVTITPTLSTSKIFIKVDTCGYINTDGAGYLTIFRGSTNLAGSGNQMTMFNTIDRYVPASMSYLDSPASTSALTYQIYFFKSGTNNIYINATNSGSSVGSITVMEIAA